jgi:hypothetical protein
MRLRLLGFAAPVVLALHPQTEASQEKGARRGVERSVVIPEDNSSF